MGLPKTGHQVDMNRQTTDLTEMTWTKEGCVRTNFATWQRIGQAFSLAGKEQKERSSNTSPSKRESSCSQK